MVLELDRGDLVVLGHLRDITLVHLTRLVTNLGVLLFGLLDVLRADTLEVLHSST